MYCRHRAPMFHVAFGHALGCGIWGVNSIPLERWARTNSPSGSEPSLHVELTLRSNLSACPEACDNQTGKRRGNWCLAKYIERARAASGVVKAKIGEMMWEKLWIEFAMATRGGRVA